MDTITYQDIPQPDGSITVVAIIDNGDGEFTSMLKSAYDAQQAAQVALQAYEATLAANSAPTA